MTNTMVLETATRSEAQRYSYANEFLKHMQGFKHQITPEQFRAIRRRAVNGDVEGARRDLRIALNKI